MTDAPADTSAAFKAAHASAYAEGPPRQVPGFASLHRMTSMLLAERVPEDGRVLVLGAGDGLASKILADDHPGWTTRRCCVTPASPASACFMRA